MQQAATTMTAASTSETIAGGTLLLAAYAIAWIIVLAYVFTLWRKSRRIEHELADVTAKLNARPSKH